MIVDLVSRNKLRIDGETIIVFFDEEFSLDVIAWYSTYILVYRPFLDEFGLKNAAHQVNSNETRATPRNNITELVLFLLMSHTLYLGHDGGAWICTQLAI